MKKNKKEKSKSAAAVSIVITVLGMLWSIFTLNESLEGTVFSFFLVTVFVVVLIVVLFSIAGKKQSAKNKAEYTLTREDFEFSDDEFELTDEDFADEDGVLTSAEEKRMEQLDNMLKNGIIDREEYRLLLKRYGLN